MSILPTPLTSSAVSTDLAPLAERATAYAAAATSENTRRAYRAAWADFAGWCQERRLEALPAATGSPCPSDPVENSTPLM